MSLVFLIMNDGLQKIDLEEKLVLGIGVSYGIIWTLIGWMAVSIHTGIAPTEL